MKSVAPSEFWLSRSRVFGSGEELSVQRELTPECRQTTQDIFSCTPRNTKGTLPKGRVPFAFEATGVSQP
jgi:hypothetical protein